MKRRNTTIHDIAKKLNITASTVSRALNDHPRISKITKQAVLKTAEELNYQPNTLASNLRKGKGKTIGVIVPRINRQFFANVIGGIEDIANQEGFRVIICQTHERYDREVENIKALLNARVDGILMSLSSDTKKFDHLHMVVKRGTPLFFFDRICPEIKTSSVVVDNFKGAYQVTSQMIKNGCKNLIHFAGPLHIQIYYDRQEGFLKALKDNNLNTEGVCFNNILTRAEGWAKMNEIMDQHQSIDGIFAAGDYSALGAYLYLQEKGISIPGQIAVAGFANEPFTELLHPALTSVEQFSEDMGRKIANLFLLHYNSDELLKSQQIVIEPEFIERESIKKYK